jgi:hypothetical protein
LTLNLFWKTIKLFSNANITNILTLIIPKSWNKNWFIVDVKFKTVGILTIFQYRVHVFIIFFWIVSYEIYFQQFYNIAYSQFFTVDGYISVYKAAGFSVIFIKHHKTRALHLLIHALFMWFSIFIIFSFSFVSSSPCRFIILHLHLYEFYLECRLYYLYAIYRRQFSS